MTDQLPPSPGDTGAPAPAPATGSESPMIPKARLDEEIGKRRAVEAEMQAIADALAAEVPSHLKPIVPEGLSPSALVKWLQKAKSTGIFAGAVQVPPTDQSPAPGLPKDRDLSTLPVHARIAAGYAKKA